MKRSESNKDTERKYGHNTNKNEYYESTNTKKEKSRYYQNSDGKNTCDKYLNNSDIIKDSKLGITN